jgi:type IV pilus assembly protein PilQ
MSQLFLQKTIMGLFVFFPLIACSAEADKVSGVKKEKEYISLNFQDIKIRSAIQLLAELSGFNLILDDKVHGQLTLRLNKIPWQHALDILLQTQGLAKRAIPNGWFISTQAAFLAADKKNLEFQRRKLASGPLFAKFLAIHYGKAVEFAHFLKSSALLSSRGAVSVDRFFNRIWIKDTRLRLAQIEKVLKQWDKQIPQVAIEARIVSLDRNKAHELGVRFGVTKATKMDIRSMQSTHQRTTYETPLLSHLTMDLPLSIENTADGPTLGIHLLRVKENAFLDLQLAALENEGNAQIISAPHLVTQDQQMASIETGENIPYQEKTASGATNIVFKKAVLALKVTPRVLPNKQLLLNLEVNQDQPSDVRVLDVPAINARHIKTKVIVKNKETIVLGGIYEHAKNQMLRHMPFLGLLPLIGALFNYKEANDKYNELLIFVTPTILEP